MGNFIFYGMCIIAVVILIGYILNYKMGRATIEFHTLELQLKTPITPDISQILEDFIEACFNDYLILNAELLNFKYINEDQEKKMVDKVVDIVSNRISTTMYKQLSVYYNEKAIPEIISNKIYELVLAYVIEFNSAKEKANNTEED